MGVGYSLRPAVFLDRDGVLIETRVKNGKPRAPRSIHGVRILPGVKEALQKLKDAGYFLAVVTNQPDVANGITKITNVEAIHAFLLRELPLDAIKVCYHVASDNCECRKPKTGMLTHAAASFEIDLSKSYMIGDQWRDIVAGHDAGCKTILIGDGYKQHFPIQPDYRANNLMEAADHALATRS